MNAPVMNSSCGHTFEKSQINGWIAACTQARKTPDCPLCKTSIANLPPNISAKQAIDVLNDPNNSLVERVEDLTTEEQEKVLLAAETIKTQREANKVLGIPDRLAKPQSFPRQVLQSFKDIYKC